MPEKKERSVTADVAEFITRTRAADIPTAVMHLGKRSILDGIGLALAGNVAESGSIVRQYLKTLGCPTDKGSTVIGTPLKVPARFAAFRIACSEARLEISSRTSSVISSTS